MGGREGMREREGGRDEDEEGGRKHGRLEKCFTPHFVLSDFMKCSLLVYTGVPSTRLPTRSNGGPGLAICLLPPHVLQ